MQKKIINIIYGVIIFFIVPCFIACMLSGDIEEIVTRILPFTIDIVVYLIILSIILMFLFKFGNLLGKKEYEKEKFSPIDKKNEEYYREILEINTPLMLSLIDNYDVSIENIVAELLYLKKRKIIDFQDEKIVVVQNDTSNLNEIHKYIIECVNEEGKMIYKKKKMIDLLLEEAEKQELLKKIPDRNDSSSKMEAVKIKGICIGMVVFSLIIYLVSLVNKNFMEALYAFRVPVSMLIIAVYIGYIDKYKVSNDLVPYVRTEKGEELNKKIEGLKKYLKEYSLLNKRDYNELELWEEYLIYSVMFGQNQKIVEETKKYIAESIFL